jgi:hypothetical protein
VTQFISCASVQVKGDLDIFVGVFSQDDAVVVDTSILPFPSKKITQRFCTSVGRRCACLKKETTFSNVSGCNFAGACSFAVETTSATRKAIAKLIASYVFIFSIADREAPVVARHNQDGARRVPHNIFRGTAKEDVFESSVTVCGDDNEIGFLRCRCANLLPSVADRDCAIDPHAAPVCLGNEVA